jgi:hypothetical protein
MNLVKKIPGLYEWIKIYGPYLVINYIWQIKLLFHTYGPNLCTIQELQSKNGVNPASRKSIARLQKGDGAMSNYKAY